MIRRPTLSQAIRRGSDLAPERCTGRYLDGSASCPLGAAFLGSRLGPGDLQRFYGLLASSSDESICEFIHVGLMKEFPILGADVRTLVIETSETPYRAADTLALYLEREGLVPRVRSENERYTPTAHLSLFGTITRLHDEKGWSKDQVAGLLAKCEL